MANFLAVVAVGLAAVGCGGGASSARMITATDVSDIPPGNRSGSTLSGSYVVTSSSVVDCECRTGPCPPVAAPPGATLGVVEQDGTLQITGASGEVDTGGVDADNTFSCGGTSSVSNGGQWVVSELLTGTFDVSNGMPTGMHFQNAETATGTQAGMFYDCDVLVQEVATYRGPTAHPLPTGHVVDLNSGQCVFISTQPQLLPACTISYTVSDQAPGEPIEVAVVESGYSCRSTGDGVYVHSMGSGTLTNSGSIPAGSYYLAITCDNPSSSCGTMVSWTATY
jgi:hypothetical protein